MADVKITALPAIASLADADLFEVVDFDLDDSSKVSAADIRAYVFASPLSADLDLGTSGLLIGEQAVDPAAPAANHVILYSKDDGGASGLYARTDDGTVHDLLSAGVTVHNALNGLLNDDHTQYLLASGARAMAGDLNLDSNEITNVARLHLALGTSTNPSIASTDNNTGLFFPFATEVALVADGNVRLTATPTQGVIIADRLTMPSGSAAAPSLRYTGTTGVYEAGGALGVATSGAKRLLVSATQTEISGDLVPNAGGSRALGTTTLYWSNVVTAQVSAHATGTPLYIRGAGGLVANPDPTVVIEVGGDLTAQLEADSQTVAEVRCVVNQGGTAGYTALRVNPTETATGSGAKYLLDLAVDDVSKFRVNNAGALDLQLLSAAGNAGAPGIAIGQTNKGLYSVGADQLGTSVAGTLRWLTTVSYHQTYLKLRPSADSTFDIGESTLFFRDTYTDRVITQAGSALSPSVVVGHDISGVDNGLYAPGGDQVGLAVAGSLRLLVGTGAAEFHIQVQPNSSLSRDLGSPTKAWKDLYRGHNIVETSAEVTTSDATPTILVAVGSPLDDNTVYSMRATIIARDAAGVERAYYHRITGAYRQGGGSALLFGNTELASSETTAGLNANFVPSGNGVVIQVTGLAGSTIKWRASIQYQKVS